VEGLEVTVKVWVALCPAARVRATLDGVTVNGAEGARTVRVTGICSEEFVLEVSVMVPR
jgi:hypothetical protein